MTDTTNLIAEARDRGDALRAMFPNDGDIRDDARLYETLADALEAAQAALARAEARIAQALNHDPLHGESSGLHCGGMAPCIRRILSGYEQNSEGKSDA